jgi:hypothetical protein
LPELNGHTTHQLTKWVDEEAEEAARRFEAVQAERQRREPTLPDMRTAISECLPIIQKMAASLKTGHKDSRLWPSVSGMGHFEVSVAPPNQERALLTLDRILRHCEASGLSWRSDEKAREPATFVIDGSSFTLRIFESGCREERELNAQEKAAIKANPNGYHYLRDRYTFRPTNHLRLEVHNPKYRSMEFTLQDSSEALLADRIAEVPAKLRERALKEKLREDIRAEGRRREEERREAHSRRVDAKRTQLERLKHFEEAANQSERAARLRLLASAMEISGKFTDEVGKEKVDWIRNAADWLDPIINKHWPVVDDV